MLELTETYGGVPQQKVYLENEKANGDSVEDLQVLKSRKVLKQSEWSIRVILVAAFLPQGYPHSVSDDYLSYQIWDTVQAFASSMTGALATEAVLRGVGVGDQAASALAASLTWLIKDGLGMIGRILFTFVKGTELDSDCKKWRLIADILNDVAFCVDLLLPAFPSLFLPMTCVSSLFRAVVGVAGGATRTAIVQHQARRNNLGDVAAKDGSQETLVNVAALVSSLILLPLVSGRFALVWTLFALFTAIHLYANWRAVRSLHIRSLNKKRATIAIQTFLDTGEVPSVVDCNEMEPLFYQGCALFAALSVPYSRDVRELKECVSVSGHLFLGCSIERMLKYSEQKPRSSKFMETQEYFLLYNFVHRTGFIAISDSKQQLKALFDLICLANGKERQNYDSFRRCLISSGYEVDTLQLGYDEWAFQRK